MHILAPGLISAAALLGSTMWLPKPVLLWNASASSRIGLYAVTSAGMLKRSDMVIAWAPRPARRLAAARHYLPFDVPLVKQVAAVEGERVCAQGKRILVNGRVAAVRSARDSRDRPMPWWSGCRTLRGGELFLLSRRAPAAFDGRYFGVTRGSAVIGKARLLWAR